MEQFSTNEAISLEKRIDVSKSHRRVNSDELEAFYELQLCYEWIKSNDYKKVCLQFPDYMLPDSCDVAARLQELSGQTVYVMGDSAYESCCVDYVTAQHIDADAIVHFGPRCGSKWTEVLPCLCIYEKGPLDVAGFVQLLREAFGKKSVRLFIDKPYLYKEGEIKDVCDRGGVILADDGKVNVYLGENDRNLMNFQFRNRINDLNFYDPTAKEPKILRYETNSAILKRRNFLIEKIKDSKTVGIVIGTLVIENFLNAINRVKTLLKAHNKKYYILSVGRPTVAKLANFPELDVYVVVCCSSSNIFESRDFYNPIVTLYDVEIALNKNPEFLSFCYDIDQVIFDRDIDIGDGNPDVSLLSGDIRFKDEIAEDESGDGKEIVAKDGTVAVGNSGAGFLAGRSFKGLEQDLGQTEVKKATEGRKGIAQSYDNELF